MPLGSTVMRLPDRTLVVYSPIAFEPAQLAAIEALGEVAHIVVPNLFHHMYATRAAIRWTRATVHAPAGIERKQRDLRIDRQLGAEAEPAWRDALDVQMIAGAPKIGEAVLFHRTSGTLVCADLVFNITRPANLRTRAVLAMMGVGGGRLAQSRVWRFAVKDREAARGSVDRLLAWPITRVATAHGDPAAIDPAGLAGRMERVYRGRPARALAAAT